MKHFIYLMILAMLSAIVVSCSDDSGVKEGSQQVASPDWRKQVIYFIMTDRFSNGDPSNDSQTTNGIELDTGRREWSYNGGDLQGIIDKLEYIQGLGVTAVWITPPVLNQWYDGSIPYTGYHGYWASDYTKVDPHYGTLAKYKELARKLHGRGMYLIQDVVPNHTGNYFTMDAVLGDMTINSQSVPAYPSDSDFSNAIVSYTSGVGSPTNAYHWTPNMNFSIPEQRTNYQESSLDDVNTEDPYMRQKMTAAFRYWIEEVGIDGMRVDTVRDVHKNFWQIFCYSTDSSTEGMIPFAQSFQKNDFLIFGEVHTLGEGTPAEQAILSGGYTKDGAGDPIMDSVVHYPLYSAIEAVFKGGDRTSLIKTVFDAHLYFRDPTRLVTFIDNHDVARFKDGGSTIKTKLALGFILTSMGIPCIYYGTEQEFSVQREAMFKNGYKGGDYNNDEFNPSSDMYQYIKKMIAIRMKYDAFTMGTQIITGYEEYAGILAYERLYGSQRIMVVMNTSPMVKMAKSVQTGFDAGTVLGNILDKTKQITIQADGKMSFTMEPYSMAIFMIPSQM